LDEYFNDELIKKIQSVFRKYGASKGIGFVPDRLEIKLERDDGFFTLNYGEYFSYLPVELRELAIENAIEVIKNMGVRDEGIEREGDGVRVKMSGDARLITFPLMELMIQNPDVEEDLSNVCDQMKNSINSLMEVMDFHWNYDEEVEEKMNNKLEKINEIIKNSPELEEEIQNIIEKHKEDRERKGDVE
jgi:hypothetical protein